MKNQPPPSELSSDDESNQHQSDLSNTLSVEDKEFVESIEYLAPHEASKKINDRFGIRDDEVLPEPGPVPTLDQEEQLFEQLRKNAEIIHNRKNKKPE